MGCGVTAASLVGADDSLVATVIFFAEAGLFDIAANFPAGDLSFVVASRFTVSDFFVAILVAAGFLVLAAAVAVVAECLIGAGTVVAKVLGAG